MPKTNVVIEKFNRLSDAAKAALVDLMDELAATQSAQIPTITRASKKGLENKPTLQDDEDVQPKRGPGRPAKAAKVEEEVTPKRRAEKTEKPAKAEKPAKEEKTVAAKAPATSANYTDLQPVGKTKGEREAYLANTIKAIEKIVSNSRSWQEEKARAEKKGVVIAFGRGKPSDASNKRKIGIALANAGKL